MTAYDANPHPSDNYVLPGSLVAAANQEAAKDDLREHAAYVADGMAAAEDSLARWRRDRDATMARMFHAGFSWAEIGRTFGVTPQAAMYASGVRQRTPKKDS